MNRKFVSMVLAAALAAVSFGASAQSEEALKHAATMEAIGKLADAMKAMAESNVKLAERVGGSQQPIIVQPATQKACDGFGSCLVSTIKEGLGVAKDILQVGTGYAGPFMSYKTAVKQYDYQAVQAKENTAQVVAQQSTLQYAFGAQRDVAVALKPTPAPAPLPAPPTTQIIIQDNTGPVNVGDGGQDNKVNPTPKVCTTSSTGVLTCSGG